MDNTVKNKQIEAISICLISQLSEDFLSTSIFAGKIIQNEFVEDCRCILYANCHCNLFFT